MILVSIADCTSETITGIICDVWTTLTVLLETRTLRRLRPNAADAGGGTGSGNVRSWDETITVFEAALLISSRKEASIDHILFKFAPPARKFFKADLMSYSALVLLFFWNETKMHSLC